MKISIDNGAHFITPDSLDDIDAILAAVPLSDLVPYMDDEAREQTAADLAPCSDAEFLRHYLEIAPADLIFG